MRETRFALTEADVNDVARLTWRTLVTWRRVLTMFAALGLLWTACVAAPDLAYHVPIDWAAVRWMWVAALVIVPVLYAASYLITPGRARRQFRQMRLLHDEQLLRWDADTVEFIGATAQTRLPWGYYRGWVLGRDTLMLQQSDRMANAVPRRALSDGDLADLLANLRSNGIAERKLFP